MDNILNDESNNLKSLIFTDFERIAKNVKTGLNDYICRQYSQLSQNLALTISELDNKLIQWVA